MSERINPDDLTLAFVEALKAARSPSDTLQKAWMAVLGLFIAAIFWGGFTLAELQTRQGANTQRITDQGVSIERVADASRVAVDKLEARVIAVEWDVARTKGRDDERREKDARQ